MANVFGLVAKPGINNVNNADSLVMADGTSEQTGGGNDILRGSSNGGNILSGGLGSDRLLGGAKDDILDGGDGNDWLSGGAGDDFLLGGAGNDVLKGGTGEDFLDGGTGDDWLSGGEGNDILTGGAGKDVFQFGVGGWRSAVNFSEQVGNDTIADFNAADDRVDLSSLFARCSDSSVAEFISAIEDMVTQDEVTMSIKNGKKTEKITDSSVDFFNGDDAYNGGLHRVGTGNELEYSLQIASKSGVLEGINGETYSYTIAASNTYGTKSLVLTLKNDDVESDTGSTITFSNIADLSAKNFIRDDKKSYVADAIIGAKDGIGETRDFSTGMTVEVLNGKGVSVLASDENDTITGTSMADSIWGNGGNDIINGGDGRDELRGNGGDDTLNGGSGNDHLHGGTGKNFLTGGEGADRFVFGGTIDDLGNFNLDKGTTYVTDFRSGQGDKIKFANMGDGYTGSLASSKLEQGLTVNSLLTEEYVRDDKGIITHHNLVISTGKDNKYVVEDFFADIEKIKSDATLEWVKSNVDKFFVYA